MCRLSICLQSLSSLVSPCRSTNHSCCPSFKTASHLANPPFKSAIFHLLYPSRLTFISASDAAVQPPVKRVDQFSTHNKGNQLCHIVMFKRSSPVSGTLFHRLQQALDQRFTKPGSKSTSRWHACQTDSRHKLSCCLPNLTPVFFYM